MRIVAKDLKKGIIKLIPENTDDLWLLSTIISPGDLVKAKTLREVRFGERGSGRSSRVPMILTIRVEHIEFQPFTTRLRVRGVVVEGPEKYGVQGKHHTLSIEPGREVEIIKPAGWSIQVLKKLEEHRMKSGGALVVSVDYDEYAIALVLGQGVKILSSGSFNLPGKDDPRREERMKEAISVLAKATAEIAMREKPTLIILVGPGSPKKLVAEKLQSMLPNYKILTDDVSIGGEPGVYEEIRRGVMRRLLREMAIVKAEELVSEFEKRLAKSPDTVAYTLDKVKAATEAGAAAEILLLDSLLRHPDPQIRRKVEELLALADATRANIHFVPEDSEVGFKLKALGGIIAILRYSYNLTGEASQPS